MRGDLIAVELHQPVDGRLQADDFEDGGRTGFKTVRCHVPRDLFLGNVRDHFPATLVRWHSLQNFALAVQDTETCRAIELVRRKDVEVGIQRLYVDRHMYNALAAIDQHLGTDGMGLGDDLVERVDRTQHVRHMRNGDDLDLRRQQAVEGGHVERAIIKDRHVPQDEAFAFGQHVPRHDIGVVLHLCRQDFVTGLQTFTETEGDQIDGFGGRLGENDLIDARVDKTRNGLTAGLIGVGRFVGQAVQTTVHIGVGMTHGVRHGVYDGIGLLRAGAAIEIDQRLAIDLTRQDRKILASTDNIKGHGSPPLRLRGRSGRLRARSRPEWLRRPAEQTRASAAPWPVLQTCRGSGRRTWLPGRAHRSCCRGRTGRRRRRFRVPAWRGYARHR